MHDPTGGADSRRQTEISGPEIRRARESYQLTQEELAMRLGVSARTVSNWEHSATVPRNRIGALSDVLGVVIDQSDPGKALLSEASPAELVAELARRLSDSTEDDDRVAEGNGAEPHVPSPRER